MVSELPIIWKQTVADRARQVSGWMSTIAALASSTQQLWSKYAYAVAVALGSNLQERASQKVGDNHIIRNARIENIGKSQSCMVSKLRIICKQTVWSKDNRAGGVLVGRDGARARTSYGCVSIESVMRA